MPGTPSEQSFAPQQLINDDSKQSVSTVTTMQTRIKELEAEAQELRRRLHASSGSAGISRVESTSSTPKSRGNMSLSLGSSGYKPLAIIVPMLGNLHDAFEEAGYLLPRPLINVVGRPILCWLLDNLTFSPQDVVFLAVPSIMERQHGISKMVLREFPFVNMRVISIPFETRGHVETIFSVVRQMTARELRLPLVTLDCSTIYHGMDVLSRFRELPSGAGASAFFNINHPDLMKVYGSETTRFSYVQLDTEGFICNIEEKRIISSSANTGAYAFENGRAFRTAAEQLLESSEAVASGLYASSLISAMIKDGSKFMGVVIQPKHFDIVWTPLRLRAFTHAVSTGKLHMTHQMRFCFDLDGTLVTEPRIPGDLTTCDPIPKAIALVHQLHAAGHTIIITTSRGMSPGAGLSAAMANAGAQTFSTLSNFDIPFDEVHFGKPCADVYVDTRTLNGQADIERELGWCFEPDAPVSELVDGAVDARSFNQVRAKGQCSVTKSSSYQILRGECHWYRSIPSALQDFFPKLVEIADGRDEPYEIVSPDSPTDCKPAASFSTITMEKIRGTTFAHLVTTRLLLKSSLRSLLRALHAIHTHKPAVGSALGNEKQASMALLCANYGAKVKKRVHKHIELYKSLGQELGIDTDRMARTVLAFLEDFEASGRATHAHYIHGDPVFSNVLNTADGKIKFIDMRGELGNTVTTQGDIHYDLSKVYQSLCGYDFMLLDQILDESSSEIFDGLRAVFWQEVGALYPEISHRDVRLHTAAHFFTIVPLHEVRSRMARYLRVSFSMLAVEGLM